MKTKSATVAAIGAALLMWGCTVNDAERSSGRQFVIEREIPGAGSLTPEQLRDASRKSVEVLRDLGPDIQWLHSYVTADKIYCVYTAPSKELIVKHADRVGIPAHVINEVSVTVGPSTANE